jgi:hypothetical protein
MAHKAISRPMANTARIGFAPPFRKANYVLFGP